MVLPALLNSSFFQAYPPRASASAFLRASQRIQQSRILFLIHQSVCSSSLPPCGRLRDFVQENRTSLRTLNHFRHLVLVYFLQLFFITLLTLQRLQVEFFKQGKILAQQSSPHSLILYFLFFAHPPPFQGVPLFCFRPVYLSRTSSSILSAKFFQHKSISLWLKLLHFLNSSVSSTTATFGFFLHLFYRPSLHH